MTGPRASSSIRRRLIWQLLLAAAILAALMFYSIRIIAGQAVEQTQDRILGAATLAIAEEMRGGADGVDFDIPYSAFSMLGAIGDDRIFYRFLVGDRTVTGYQDLPLPAQLSAGLEPQFYSTGFQGDTVRVAAVRRQVLVGNRAVPVLILVAQTRGVQESIVAGLANRAAALGIGFFALAAVLALLTARSVLQPVNALAEAVTRRGPQDLRPVTRPAPLELQPMVRALNGFMARLSGALSRTETFIAEAAHHIRTPLATLRAQSEIALRQTTDPAATDSLRRIIRLTDDTARSAGQLLDHAAVIYRTDQRNDQDLSLDQIVTGLAETLQPAADLKDVALMVHKGEYPVTVNADQVLVETAIRNLIDNAIKYSADEGQVDIFLEAIDGFADIRVLDRGRGLGGLDADTLVRRFGRGRNVADVVGSGLGLAMAAEVARAYGGNLQINEREGGGACASLQLPLA